MNIRHNVHDSGKYSQRLFILKSKYSYNENAFNLRMSFCFVLFYHIPEK